MIDVDTFVKIILSFSISVSILVFAISFYRLVSKIIELIKDVRIILGDVGQIAEQVTKDYFSTRELVSNIGDVGKFLSQLLLIFKLPIPNNRKKKDKIEK